MLDKHADSAIAIGNTPCCSGVHSEGHLFENPECSRYTTTLKRINIIAAGNITWAGCNDGGGGAILFYHGPTTENRVNRATKDNMTDCGLSE